MNDSKPTTLNKYLVNGLLNGDLHSSTQIITELLKYLYILIQMSLTFKSINSHVLKLYQRYVFRRWLQVKLKAMRVTRTFLVSCQPQLSSISS